MDEKLLAVLIKKLWPFHDKDTLAEMAGRLAKEIASLQDIRQRLSNNRRLVEEEHVRHKSQLSALATELSDIWDACPHLVRTHHGDPSGGSDRSETCSLCGKEFR